MVKKRRHSRRNGALKDNHSFDKGAQCFAKDRVLEEGAGARFHRKFIRVKMRQIVVCLDSCIGTFKFHRHITSPPFQNGTPSSKGYGLIGTGPFHPWAEPGKGRRGRAASLALSLVLKRTPNAEDSRRQLRFARERPGFSPLSVPAPPRHSFKLTLHREEDGGQKYCAGHLAGKLKGSLRRGEGSPVAGWQRTGLLEAAVDSGAWLERGVG